MQDKNTRNFKFWKKVFGKRGQNAVLFGRIRGIFVILLCARISILQVFGSRTCIVGVRSGLGADNRTPCLSALRRLLRRGLRIALRRRLSHTLFARVSSWNDFFVFQESDELWALFSEKGFYSAIESFVFSCYNSENYNGYQKSYQYKCNKARKEGVKSRLLVQGDFVEP